MKRIEAIIGYEKDDYTWLETYDITDEVDAEEYMNRMVDRFNSSIRGNESKRKVVSIKVLDDTLPYKHQWEKTNLVTIHGRNVMYDTCKCKICGITGRRYGIGEFVKRDRKYTAKCYETCKSTIEHLNKLKK